MGQMLLCNIYSSFSPSKKIVVPVYFNIFLSGGHAFHGKILSHFSHFLLTIPFFKITLCAYHSYAKFYRESIF